MLNNYSFKKYNKDEYGFIFLFVLRETITIQKLHKYLRFTGISCH